MSNDCLIVLLRGMAPILAKRVKWYQDRAFNPAAPRLQKQRSQHQVPLWLMFAVVLIMYLLAWLTA